MARPAGSADSSTRRRIAEILKVGGPATAAELAAELGVSDVAVRQHLSTLEAEGLIAYEAVAAGRGRPQRRWSLTEAAAKVFPDAHAELAVGLLGAMVRTLDEDAMRAVLIARGREQVKGYRRDLPDDADLAARVAHLAEQRSAEGYMAVVEEAADGGLLLVERHCPICSAATECQRLCRSELHVFRRVLGRGVKIERVEHLLAGDRRCAYRISER